MFKFSITNKPLENIKGIKLEMEAKVIKQPNNTAMDHPEWNHMTITDNARN